MTDKFDVKVVLSDTKRIVDRLSTLPDKLQKRSGRTAARRAMRIVRQTAVNNARRLDDPNTAEMIAKNVAIQYSPRQSRRQGGIVMRVGILGGAKQYADTKHNVRKGRVGKSYKTGGDKSNPGGDTWYWRFLEFGTSKMRARPFLASALSSNTQAVTDAATRELSAAIDKEIKSA